MRAVGRAEQETALPGWAVQTAVHGTLESSDVQGLLCDGQRPPLPFRVNLEPLGTSRSSAHCRSVPTQRPLARWPALPPEAVRGRLRPVPGPATLSLALLPRSSGADAGADGLLAGAAAPPCPFPCVCYCAYCRASSVSGRLFFQFKFTSIPVFIRVFYVGIPCKKPLERKELQLQTKHDRPSFLPGPLS